MKRLAGALALLALLFVGAVAGALAYLQVQGVAPRALAPVLKGLNWLRKKAHQPPLKIDG